MVGIMTSLWFGHLGGDDKVAVKPHAPPVYHAIRHLTRELDRSYLTRLWDAAELQAYLSRTKDPDVADFSTGSVGLGAIAPAFAAATRRYIEAHFGPRTERPASLLSARRRRRSRRRQRLGGHRRPGAAGPRQRDVDRRCQSARASTADPRHEDQEADGVLRGRGWHVVEAKYGHLLQAAFARSGGESLRQHIDAMSNEEYQSLFGQPRCRSAPALPGQRRCRCPLLLDDVLDDDLPRWCRTSAVTTTRCCLIATGACDDATDRPSIVFAYTVKGWGLPIAGDPLNHARC